MAMPSVMSTPRLSSAILRPGDLVVNRQGYPMLYEVIGQRDDGLVRVRGLQWASGYSALVSPAEVQPVSGQLRD